MNNVIVLLCLFFYCLSAQETRQYNGQTYLVTSLSKAQVGDPYSLAEKYGKASNWKDILIVRGGQVLKMTDSLSNNIDDNETLLVPLSWVPGAKPQPTQPPRQPSPPTQPPPTTTPRPPSGPTPGTWKKAVATYYESYPTTQEEAEQFSGDQYKGMFALFDDQKPLSWVQSHSLVAISDKFWNSYKGKNIKISLYPDGRNAMDVQVVDQCSDKDCDGCCSANMRQAGVDFLIDLEKFTAAKFLGKTPAQIVKEGLFRTIYYSTGSTSAAVSENSRTFTQAEPVSNSLSPMMIGLIVGCSVLVVIIVIVVVVINRKQHEEKV